MTTPVAPLTTCPRGTDLSYAVCCGRWHAGGRVHRLMETSRFVREHWCWHDEVGDIAP
jgi:uncharacterized protein YchJ